MQLAYTSTRLSYFNFEYIFVVRPVSLKKKLIKNKEYACKIIMIIKESITLC